MRNDQNAPTFEAPWQAQAFALTVHLQERGLFTWTEWSEALGAERRRSAEAHIADDTEQYYHDWLRALEGLLTSCGRVTEDELALFRQAWIAAYDSTPHGQPVHLDKGFAALNR